MSGINHRTNNWYNPNTPNTAFSTLVYNTSNPKKGVYRNKLVKESDNLKEGCYRRLLLDIYMKVLPLDADYVNGNRGMCVADTDKFLQSKDQTATQYFRSASNATKAPLLEYVIDYVNDVGRIFIEAEMDKVDDDEEAGIDPPDAPPETDDEEVENQLVDVKKDMEYENFIDVLKKKTIKKIINDISAMINDKKDESEMTFSPKNESTAFTISFNYIIESFLKNQVELPANKNELVGMAIREATWYMIDRTFKQADTRMDNYSRSISSGRAVVVFPEAVQYMFEKGNMDDVRPLNEEESNIADKKFGKAGSSIKHCSKGYYAITHNARTKFYPSLDELPAKEVRSVNNIN